MASSIAVVSARPDGATCLAAGLAAAFSADTRSLLIDLNLERPELAALLEDRRIPRRVDPQAIDAYLALLYVPHPLSAIAGVRKLPPASAYQNCMPRISAPETAMTWARFFGDGRKAVTMMRAR